MTIKEFIIRWIDNLVIYEFDYDILLKILDTNDRFFIRIMTELALGNLKLDDFETLVGGDSFDIAVKNKFETNKKLEESLSLILQANQNLREDDNINKQIFENLIIDTETYVDSEKTKNIMEDITDEEIYSYFKNNPESSMLDRLNKKKLLDLYYNGIIDKNFLNKYIDLPVIPINYNDIILSEEDKMFALRKGISHEELKKMKSLRYYYKAKGE